LIEPAEDPGMRRVLMMSGLLWGGVAAAQVTPIEPFVGEKSDPLNYPFTLIAAEIPIFGGQAKMQSHDGVATYIHLLASSTLGGDPVTPRTGARILGFTQGPGILLFDPPVRQFGSYFNNNSAADDGTADFYGVDGELLASLSVDIPVQGNVWTWNGWESSEPISRVVLTGNGILNGFLWTDDLELSYVPEPGGALALGVAAVWLLRRRRRPDRERMAARGSEPV
jgi:hypothetical protein